MSSFSRRCALASAMCFLAVSSVAAVEVETIVIADGAAAMTTTSALHSDAPTNQPAFSAAHARPGEPVYVRPSRFVEGFPETGRLGQATAGPQPHVHRLHVRHPG